VTPRLISLLPAPPGRALLFCLHHSGGGGATFSDWPRRLDHAVQVATVILPGRERLSGEPPATDFDAIVEQVCEEVQGLVADRPYALFGHSLGAALAFEVGCRLERHETRAPSGLIVSGRGPLHLDGSGDGDDSQDTSALSDDALVDRLRRMGGTPPEVLANRELLALVLPRLRADFRLGEGYRWDGSTRSRCPTLVLGGTSDPFVPVDRLDRWRDLTTGEVTVRVVDGGHLFVTSRKEEVCRAVGAFLDQCLPGDR